MFELLDIYKLEEITIVHGKFTEPDKKLTFWAEVENEDYTMIDFRISTRIGEKVINVKEYYADIKKWVEKQRLRILLEA